MSKLLTIEDLRNANRASGFRHVHSGAAGPNGGGRTTLWKARHKGLRLGPYRREPALAAQDYCDYINGGTTLSPAVLRRVKKHRRPETKRRQVTRREAEARKIIREEIQKNPIPKLHEPVCYLIGVKMDMLAVKVGYADYNVYSRLDSLQTGNPRELVLLATLPGGKETEAKLHSKHAATNRLGEWFSPTGALLKDFKLSFKDYKEKVR